MLGFSREEMDFLQDSPMRKFSSVKKAEFTHISDGDALEYGGRRLRVHRDAAATRQATSASMTARTRSCSWATTSSSISRPISQPGRASRTRWAKYVHSLMDISIFDVRLPLPAHRTVSCTMAERIGTIIEHHGARIRELIGVLEHEPGLTAYEIAGRMRWKVRGQELPAWEDFPLQQKWFAVGEAAVAFGIPDDTRPRPQGGIRRSVALLPLIHTRRCKKSERNCSKFCSSSSSSSSSRPAASWASSRQRNISPPPWNT